MKIPNRRDVELNEVHWWSKWARLRWHGDGFLLSSDDLREPFFNHAGSLTCAGVSGTVSWAEPHLSRLGMGPSFLIFDSCEATKTLLSSGYRQVDTMTVLLSKGAIGAETGNVAATATTPDGWTSVYLRAFYETENLAGVVKPIVSSLLKSKAAALLESRIGGKTTGVLALFRTRGIAGIYCVGTAPDHRGEGVATTLLAKAKEIAESEGRAMVLQTLKSDGTLRFYLDRGFEALYSKSFLEKAQITPEGASHK